MATTIDTVQEFWQRARAILAEKLQSDDFSFLDGLLTKGLRGVMREVLIFASGQETFPDVPGLSSYLKTKGYKHWILTDLKNHSFVINSAPGKGTWRLTGLSFQNLLKVPEATLQPKKPDEKTADIGLTEKQRAIWDYLQRERVGDELMVTTDHMSKAAEKANCDYNYVALVLKRLADLGLLKYESQGRGRGILVNFKRNQGLPKAKVSDGSQMLLVIDQEILQLEAKIEKREKELQDLRDALAKKNLVRDEIKRLADIV